MDVNRGEGLDGEHASPGRTLSASSPSSQKFLRLPPPLAGGKSFLFVLVSLCIIVFVLASLYLSLSRLTGVKSFLFVLVSLCIIVFVLVSLYLSFSRLTGGM